MGSHCDIKSLLNSNIGGVEIFRNDLPLRFSIAFKSEATNSIFTAVVSNQKVDKLAYLNESIHSLEKDMAFPIFLDSMIELLSLQKMVCDESLFNLVLRDRGTQLYQYQNDERTKVRIQRLGSQMTPYLSQVNQK